MRAGELYETDTSIFRKGPTYYWAVELDHSDFDDPTEISAMKQWAQYNLSEPFYVGETAAMFVSADDAIAFKLRFA